MGRILWAGWLLAVAQAVSAACAPPRDLGDGWGVQPEAQASGFDPIALCGVLESFAQSPANVHSLLVERHGRLVAEAYKAGRDESIYSIFATRTEFDAATRHDLRSISKSVVSLLWGIADAQGRMPPLQTPALDLFPELADLKRDGRERITVEDLLAMRSGLDWSEMGAYGSFGNDENGLAWRGGQARYLFDRPLAAPPGERFNYNGGHTAVLAAVLAERTGMPIDQFAGRFLFAPLGITDWEWVHDLRGRPLAYAGLRLRPRDLAKLGRMVLDQGRWHGRQVVPAEWLGRSLASHVATTEIGSEGYGYQWWIGRAQANGVSYEWQAGVGNGGQRLFMVPALDLVVVMTAGDYNRPQIAGELRRLLTQVLAAAAPKKNPAGG